MSKAEKKQLKRQQAIEPVIGHTKHNHRMIRCHLKGSIGDALHAINCAAGYNIRWAILRLDFKDFFALAFLATARLKMWLNRSIQDFRTPSTQDYADYYVKFAC